jgi:hypothetical protein
MLEDVFLYILLVILLFTLGSICVLIINIAITTTLEIRRQYKEDIEIKKKG